LPYMTTINEFAV